MCCADFKAPQSLRDSSPQGSERQQMQLLATVPSCEKATPEDPQIFRSCNIKNIFPLMMAQRTRSHFKSSALHKFRKCFPHITGEVQCSQRAHRAFTAQLHRPGHARFDGVDRFCPAAIGPDVFC